MVHAERQHAALPVRRRRDRAGASHLKKLCGLLVLVLLLADLITRQIALLAEPTTQRAPASATANFFSVQVGDFHAEIRWNTLGREE